MRIRAEICTHTGKVRPNNEDNFFLNGLTLPAPGEKRGFYRCRPSVEPVQLFAVADGMGGQAAGEKASALAVRYMGALHAAVEGGEEAREAIAHCTAEANEAVVALQRDAGSTLVMLLLAGGAARVAWLGDSRAYLMREGQLYRLSEDHTEAQRMRNLGIEPIGGRSANVLTRHLGMDIPGLVVEPSFAKDIELKKRDVFLLCSDGLTGLVEEERIACILDESERPARALVEAALAAGGADNVTALVVDVVRLKPLFAQLRAKFGG